MTLSSKVPRGRSGQSRDFEAQGYNNNNNNNNYIVLGKIRFLPDDGINSARASPPNSWGEFIYFYRLRTSPYPSYPALCRADTTHSWSSDDRRYHLVMSFNPIPTIHSASERRLGRTTNNTEPPKEPSRSPEDAHQPSRGPPRRPTQLRKHPQSASTHGQVVRSTPAWSPEASKWRPRRPTTAQRAPRGAQRAPEQRPERPRALHRAPRGAQAATARRPTRPTASQRAPRSAHRAAKALPRRRQASPGGAQEAPRDPQRSQHDCRATRQGAKSTPRETRVEFPGAL